MPNASAKRILFSGYAPVHFLCYLPIYERLKSDPRVELYLSGGFRHKDGDQVSYHLDGFYDHPSVDPSHVVDLETTKANDYDVLVCSHLSDTLFPRSVATTVQIYHGVSFKNYAVRDKALRFDMLCLPGEYHAERYREAGLVRVGGSKVFLTGFAKNDRMVNGTLDRTETLRSLGLDASIPTILYAPTGDKNNSLETMGEQVIEQLAAVPHWNLVIKPHDHPKNRIDWFSRLARFEGPRTKVVRDFDVVPLLHATDLLISDASSVVTEFTLLDRPIVLLHVPKLLKRVVTRGGALDLQRYAYKVGPVVKDANTIASVVSAQLGDSSEYSEVRRAMATHVFYKPGTATGRVAGVIRYAAKLLDDVPADVARVRPMKRSADGDNGQAGRYAMVD